jgi:hypothetical protein
MGTPLYIFSLHVAIPWRSSLLALFRPVGPRRCVATLPCSPAPAALTHYPTLQCTVMPPAQPANSKSASTNTTSTSRSSGTLSTRNAAMSGSSTPSIRTSTAKLALPPSTSCYNFSHHVTVGPTSDHVGWPAQLLESRLAYFVLGVTLTADSGPGFVHMRSR